MSNFSQHPIKQEYEPSERKNTLSLKRKILIFILIALLIVVGLFIFQWVNRKVVSYNLFTNYTQIIKESIDDNVVLIENRYDYDREEQPEEDLHYHYFSPAFIGNNTVSFVSAQSTETIRYKTLFFPSKHDYKIKNFTIQNISLNSLPIGTTIIDTENSNFPYSLSSETQTWQLSQEFKKRKLFFFSYENIYSYGNWADAQGEPYIKINVSEDTNKNYYDYPYKVLYISLLDGSFIYLPDAKPITYFSPSQVNSVEYIDGSHFENATYSVSEKQSIVYCDLDDLEKVLYTNPTLLEKFPSLKEAIENLNPDDFISFTFIINNIETKDQIYALFSENI